MNIKYMDKTVVSLDGGVTLNGTPTANADFYAPLAAGEKGQVLMSEGTGAPAWKSAMTLPVGMIMPFAGIEAPSGWLKCDGSEVSRTEYADLFAAIGTLYGDGNKVTTFNLPNLVGKYIGGDSDAHTVGSTSDPQAQNIKGNFNITYHPTGNGTGPLTAINTSGYSIPNGAYSGSRLGGFTFDATRKSDGETANPIYKAGLTGDDRLRPATVYMSYMIKC